MNYCLVYRTSETSGGYRFRFQEVNYYLVYHTSETRARCVVSVPWDELLLELRYFRNCPLTALCSHGVSYCLDYRTSETELLCPSARSEWTAAWFMVPPKHWKELWCLVRWWTTTWITVPPKRIKHCRQGNMGELLGLRAWTTAWFTVSPKLRESGKLIQIRWTTTWITVLPKPSSSFVPIKLGLN